MIFREMEIDYSREHEPGFLRFEYERFCDGKELASYYVWCRNLGDFLSLIFYWSNHNGCGFEYKPSVDKYGYIRRPTW